MIPPRIRGRIGQIEEGPDHIKGKWAVEIQICNIYGKQLVDPITLAPYDTEDIAKAECRRVIKTACEVFQKELGGDLTGTYLDLKDGATVKSWAETEVH